MIVQYDNRYANENEPIFRYIEELQDIANHRNSRAQNLDSRSATRKHPDLEHL
jgi:hypothetical protein